ncbi:hypothetical protein [Cypionkella sp. TWP1-2-1b2]|uniref:hypothetical protein n=1 Tax=Cypionkella sp. TWP1-2-1b2 TaxID=2804675 RepID=UPI003CECD641
MIMLDHIRMHALCAKVATEAIDPDSVFGPEDSQSLRTSIFGGAIRARDHANFLAQCAGTLQAIGLKAGFVAAWKRENGKW